MLVPPNVNSFYSSKLDKTTLYQGDILRADGVGLKTSDEFSPDYWMIITKSCDLVIMDGLPRKQNVSIFALFSFPMLHKLFKSSLIDAIPKKKIVVMAISQISKVFCANQVENLIKNRITKFMFLPPDGKVFNEPMIIDFDLVTQLDGSAYEEVQNVLGSKVLELASPFRERIAQRFAEHYCTIGIDDVFIRQKEYVKSLKGIISTS